MALAGADLRDATSIPSHGGLTGAAPAASDRKLDGVYKAAAAKSKGQVLATLKAEQRGWIGGRNECWKVKGPDNPAFITASWQATSVRECVEAQYKVRTAEIQSRWRLLTPKGPVFYACQNNPANEVVATFLRSTDDALPGALRQAVDQLDTEIRTLHEEAALAAA